LPHVQDWHCAAQRNASARCFRVQRANLLTAPPEVQPSQRSREQHIGKENEDEATHNGDHAVGHWRSGSVPIRDNSEW
jgi:hypothetical protein